jgi:circadian clock protein KaiC
LWRGSTTLVTGAAGSGKTTLGIGFCIAAVEAGEQALLLNFQEDPAQLARSIRALGVDLDSARGGGLRLLYASPVELQIDSLVSSIFDALDDGVSRVVIDAAGDLALAARSPDRFYDYVYSLIKHFAARRVTTLFTLEQTGLPDMGPRSARARFDSMTDAIIELGVQLEGGARRTLRVVKARGISHDLNAHDIEIHDHGIRVVNVVDGA